jgi:hypothetical protein
MIPLLFSGESKFQDLNFSIQKEKLTAFVFKTKLLRLRDEAE